MGNTCKNCIYWERAGRMVTHTADIGRCGEPSSDTGDDEYMLSYSGCTDWVGEEHDCGEIPDGYFILRGEMAWCLRYSERHKMLLAIAFCPFCGQALDENALRERERMAEIMREFEEQMRALTNQMGT